MTNQQWESGGIAATTHPLKPHICRLGQSNRSGRAEAAVVVEIPAAAPGGGHYHIALGQFAGAARWLEKCMDQRDTRAPWILPNLWGPAFPASEYLAAPGAQDEPPTGDLPVKYLSLWIVDRSSSPAAALAV